MNGRCQLQYIEQVSEPIGAIELLWQRRSHVRRILKRRFRYLMNLLSEMVGTKEKAKDKTVNRLQATSLQPGDMVRVKSREEIQATLNRWNQLKGCSFMEEMWLYCGTTQKVLKRIERFLDERDYLLKKCKDIVILENVYCEGTVDFGDCDRMCFIFWREEWLKKT